MTDYFRDVRNRLTAVEVARTYGLTFDHHGKALCPFHNDHHPSMTFKGGRFRCWVCDAGGTSIDLAMRLFNLTPLEAVRKLDTDFNLGLMLDRPPRPEDRREALERDRVKEVYEDFEEWRWEMLTVLNATIRTANLALKSWDPSELLPHEAVAVRWRETLEDWADTLSRGDLAQQMSIFRDRRGVTDLCNRILRPTPMKSQVA